MSDKEALGVWLAEQRKRLGISQLAFGTLIDVNQNLVSEWETGIISPRGLNMLQILNVFGLSDGNGIFEDIVEASENDKEAGEKMFGCWLKYQRMKAGCSRKELGEVTHMPEDTIMRYERGDWIPIGIKLLYLMSAFGIDKNGEIGRAVEMMEASL